MNTKPLEMAASGMHVDNLGNRPAADGVRHALYFARAQQTADAREMTLMGERLSLLVEQSPDLHLDSVPACCRLTVSMRSCGRFGSNAASTDR